LPGGITAAATTGLPPFGGLRSGLDVVGKIHSDSWRGKFEACDEGYFSTLGFQFLQGQPFSAADVANRRKVAVVNQTLVSRYFGHESPLGKHLRVDQLSKMAEKVPEPVFEIVGIVADMRNDGLEDPIVPVVFIPSTIVTSIFPVILVRTSIDPRNLIPTLRKELRAINKNAFQPDLMTADDMLGTYVYSRPRFSLFLMSIFAGIGLLLVGTGIYGVMAYAVSQQTREIGIRMALGAEPAQVFSAVFGVAVRLIGLGLAVGALGSLLMNRLVAQQVWKVAPFDPLVLILCVATIVILGLAACYVPALRATRIQPLIALRHD
jgi:putative ABC transport system permease protein